MVELKFDFVSEHFPDDHGKLAGTMPEGIIVGPAFRPLGVIVRFEGGIVLYNIVGYVNECVSEHSGAALGHSGALGAELPDW